MTHLEKSKAMIKNMIPWQIRYGIKKYEAAHPSFHLPMKGRQDVIHYNDVLYEFVERMGGHECFKGKTVCELGPGEFLTHAALLYQMGVDRTYLLDIADLANSMQYPVKAQDVVLSDVSRRLRRLPRPCDNETWDSYIRKLNSVYATDGLHGYKMIPDETVEICFSDAVFEHIRKNIFRQTMEEIYRFSKKGALSCHIVDLRDHMGGGKNHLRFADEVWEDEVHYRMDNYTNRLTCKEICEICKDAGFQIVKIERNLYEKVPLVRNRLADRFKSMDEEELMTKTFMVMMQK